jgi:very-short-patch-repair endonuclease
MIESISLTCEFLHDPTVNFAMQQNHVPVVKRLRITNSSNFDLVNFKVQITAEPEFASVWEMSVASIHAGQTVDLGIIDLQLSPVFLAGLAERIEGRLFVNIFKDESPVYSSQSSIAILAYDEWNGAQTLPEIIAAFVTPNHPEVAKILRKAADILKEWTGSPSLDGYQSKDPIRVRKQLAAIYAALQQQNITYCVPPASFEEQGQKIRMPDVIQEFHLATCLDLTVLFATCAEAAGLNPLIIFIKGHAFPGAWLVGESFSESLQDDVTHLTKRIAPGVQEICVLESTAITSRPNCSFDDAVALGENNLSNSDDFHFFVDVRRARASQIRPLPLRSQGRLTVDDKTPSLEMPITHQAPEDVEKPILITPEDKIEGERTRLEQWERRLLDLSLRNPLLNFRVTGTCIPLLKVELNELEDQLADGRDFKIYPRPADWEENPRDARVFQRRQKNDPMVKLLQEELSQQRLRADLTEKDLSNRLTQLYRAARTSLEENGANTLYMALGSLVWYESEVSQKLHYAPILLLPMELVRKSVQTGYVVRHGDDDPQLNITLVEMLKQDFGIDISGLNPLPTDEHGIDVRKIFTTIRRSVMNKPRWDVLENAYLGLFSFSKFVMWHDLKARAEELKRNKIVSSLISGSLQWTPESNYINDEKLDETCHPREIICPISADSSQLSAVRAAGQGRSIVLHGPPGTGKSQTITNIIAHVLAQGKSVLFVAEKMAALTVVQRRLEQIGLAPFCVEVYSNKSKKKDILEQLRKSLEIEKITRPQNWLAEADRLAALRDDLNKYVHALHRKRTIGHSFFYGLAESLAVRQSPAVVNFKLEQVVDTTPEKLQKWTELARQLRIAGEGCGHPYGHVWSLSLCQDYLPQLRTQLADALSVLRGAINNLLEARAPVVKFFTLAEQDESFTAMVNLFELAKQFLNTPPMPGIMVRLNDWDDVRTAVESWIIHGRIRDKLRAEVYSRYTGQVAKLDVAGMQENLRTVKQQWFIPRFFGMRRITKTLRGMLKPGVTIGNEQVENDLEQLRQLQEEESFLSSASDRAREMIGSLWRDGNANWDLVANACVWTANLRKLAVDIAGTNLEYLGRLRENWSRTMTEFREQLGLDGTYSKKLNSYIDAYNAFASAWQAFVQLAMLDQEVLVNSKDDRNWFTQVLEQIHRWEENLEGVRDWCAWRRVRAEGVDAGLEPLIKPYEMGELAHDQVEPAFLRGFYQAWIESEFANDPVLSSFSRGLFEDKIRQFRELDETFAQLTKQEVYARLAARLPQLNGDTLQNSEMGILQREILKQRNHMALRQLFSKIPNLLTRLKPCLLMSPISVAQYLDPAHSPFDLVIFDEASQVPTCEAVGAIARGKEAIIVGDPNQLPPTSFFMTMNTDDDDGLDIKDLESILDDCLAIRMPEEHLRWHYRSQHESLISFSNYQYYNNSLHTFPSPDDLTPAVKIVYVEGVYDRGKSKQNRAEADAIVAEVVKRLLDPELSKRNIGVVTFSQAQQRLIEDLLDEQVRQNPEIECFFNSSVEEPVFVKNLENVQGDERDVILFSVGYGPDAQGRISYNFGPLNREGGWRRLNVAVSRARQEMMVFSTLRSDQLDLSRTNAKGVADLKAFLEYAERGKQALYMQHTATADAEHDTLFEEQVSLALKEKGYKVQAQVGCSGYKIDLAIVDPDRPGRYLLGIECDGATYHRSKTARDRDKLREMVLRKLGWKIHRIWSTDWWENQQRELDRVEVAIASARRDAGADVPKRVSVVKTPPPTARYARAVTIPTTVEKPCLQP